MATAVVAALLGLATAGCERPFVDISTPEIAVVAPDVTTAFFSESTQLVLRASSFREVTRVTVNGLSMDRNPGTGNWEANLQLMLGLNLFVVEASDLDEVTSTDTLYALRLAAGRAVNAPLLQWGRGGHTATALSGGGMIVAGGAPTANGEASTEILELFDTGGAFSISTARLNDARAGHTASLLPDGRILFAGGARRASVPELESLVETVEIFELNSRTVTEIPFVGAPIRRAYHTANVRVVGGATIIDLFGGRGDVSYNPPRLSIRGDIRSFELRNDTLFALGPGVGGSLFRPLYGHTQTSMFGSEPAPTEFLFAGGLYEPNFPIDETVALVNFADPRGLIPEVVPLPAIPRTQHADVRLRSGIVALFGGRTDAAGTLTGTVEVFARQARRFFTVPVTNLRPAARYAHTVTPFFGQQLLITGGFDQDGNGLRSSEIFVIEL